MPKYYSKAEYITFMVYPKDINKELNSYFKKKGLSEVEVHCPVCSKTEDGEYVVEMILLFPEGKNKELVEFAYEVLENALIDYKISINEIPF